MNKTIEGKRYGFYLHRLLTNAPKGMEVDHIDRDKLNNKRENLRIVTSQENKWNRDFDNVSFHKASGLWISYFSVNGKQKVRYSKTREEALRVAKELKKKYYKINSQQFKGRTQK